MIVSDFSDDEKAAIRSYLGFSALFFQIDPRLEGQMVELPRNVPSAATRVRGILDQLSALDAKLTAALGNLDLVKAEDVTFLGPEQLKTLRAHGRMLVQQLGIIFELAPKRDYYDDGGGVMGGAFALG